MPPPTEDLRDKINQNRQSAPQPTERPGLIIQKKSGVRSVVTAITPAAATEAAVPGLAAAAAKKVPEPLPAAAGKLAEPPMLDARSGQFADPEDEARSDESSALLHPQEGNL